MKFLTFVCGCLLSVAAFAQQSFTREDTLRGTITPERAWWDLTFYKLNVRVFPEEQSLSGSVIIRYRVVQSARVMQVDLQPPLTIDKVTQDGVTLTYKKDGSNAYLITLSKPQQKGREESIEVFYSGKPVVATNPPWVGGVQWVKDKEGNHFIATSCQGLGSSVWWPCKDHMYDEVDSMSINITVPGKLMDVSNGQLKKIVDNHDGTKTYEWYVKNPINNYGVNMNIANYTQFSDTLRGEKGVLKLDYFVLPENLEKAKAQFTQVKPMLRAFEYWFGPYPFYEDGYKLVEVPYLGMEHQSSVTYGNQYQNGYLGRDLSGTGWGLKWDFIIIHESGHEWFANNITYKDMADMWVHESFTNYSESLYIEYHYGKEAASAYIIGTRRLIQNDSPIVGVYGVNNSGSGDMYPKGGNMLNTIRHVVDDDKKWRDILRGLNETFFHKTVDGKDIEKYISDRCGRDLSKVFDQYLRDTRIPKLEYSLKDNKLSYRWTNCVDGFDMPVRMVIKDKGSRLIFPVASWKSMRLKADSVAVDVNFYVESAQIESTSSD
jgi:aminopeptidase N